MSSVTPSEPEGGEGYSLTIPDSIRAGRADKIMALLIPEFSRTRWQKLFQEGRVWRDDHILSQKQLLRPGSQVQYSLPPLEPLKLRPVPMPISVLYEDADILVLDKEPGRVVHPGAGTGEDTLVHGLLHHCKDSLSGIGGTERPGIVHRLDKETSGVLIVAKSDAAYQGLAWQFSQHCIEKYYTALSMGFCPKSEKGIIIYPIGRHPVHRTRMTCRKDGRWAKTDFLAQQNWGQAASRFWLQIHTGRTHQIRVHLKEIGHPILGDTLYGFRETSFEKLLGSPAPLIPRVLLHATKIVFDHPINKKKMTIEAPLPGDFLSVMRALDEAMAARESH